MDITQFPELQYIGKNRLLPEHFKKAFFPTPDDQEEFIKYISFFQAVILQDWKLVDLYLKDEYCNMVDYRNIFALLFKFHYRCGLIDKKQFQIALQIQQVRTHPLLYEKYEFYRKEYDKTLNFLYYKKANIWRVMRKKGKDAVEAEQESKYIDELVLNKSLIYDSWELVYFDDLDPETQESIVHVLVRKWRKNCIYKNPQDWKAFCETKIKEKLQRSVWYKTLCWNNAYIMPYSKNPSANKYSYFPIPETLNFSSFLYTYEPQIVAGLLRSSTYIHHIYKFKKRPFVLFHPDVRLGLVHATSKDIFFPIAHHWLHDFYHMSEDFISEDNIEQKRIKQIIQKKNDLEALGIHDHGILLHPQSQWQHHHHS